MIALGRNLLLQFRHFRRPWRSAAGAVRAERSDARTAGPKEKRDAVRLALS